LCNNFFQVIRIYAQSVHCTQWFRRDAGASFKGGGLEGSTDSLKIYDFSFFFVNCTFETVLLLQKQYIMQKDPQRSLRPQQFTEMMPLTWCHGWRQH